MDAENTPLALEDFQGERIISIREFEEDGAQWTAFTLDNGFEFHVSGAVAVIRPLPN